MQIDLHHTGIYVLCRVAGMKSDSAEIVAYASQQVDDATHDHALKFENGGVFRQTRTSDKLMSPKNLDINDALEVWMPFHFLPSNPDIEIEASQICRPQSRLLKLLLENTEEASSSPLALYRLGISLHCFADTYSHQDFKGFFDKYNMVTLLSGAEEKNSISKKTDKLLQKHVFNPLGILAVGHGEVLSNPDIPYGKWAYTRGDQEYHVDNLSERFIVALREIFSFLTEYVKNNKQFHSPVEVKPFEQYEEKFLNVLQYEGSGAERHSHWLDLIHTNYFKFEDFNEIDKNLSYDSRSWFKEAVTVVPVSPLKKFIAELINNCDFYQSKEGFHVSHWAKFMHAAAEHQFLILHKLLPKDQLY